MKILRILDIFINMDETLKMTVSDGEKADSVNIQYKDKRGDWYTQTLVRKDNYIGDPLTTEEIRAALVKALTALGSADVSFVSLTDYMDEEKEEENE